LRQRGIAMFEDSILYLKLSEALCLLCVLCGYIRRIIFLTTKAAKQAQSPQRLFVFVNLHHTA
jgi:hypothetical protein